MTTGRMPTHCTSVSFVHADFSSRKAIGRTLDRGSLKRGSWLSTPPQLHGLVLNDGHTQAVLTFIWRPISLSSVSQFPDGNALLRTASAPTAASATLRAGHILRLNTCRSIGICQALACLLTIVLLSKKLPPLLHRY